MSKIELPIEKPSKDFEAHLALEDNGRIFFSGIFGSGKTYFLRKFFEQHQDKYLSVQLSPVHYAAAYNEDIFEFIRHDIIFKLTTEVPELYNTIKAEAEADKKSSAPAEFIKTKIPEIIKGLVTMLPNGKSIVGGADRIEGTLNEYETRAQKLLDLMNETAEKYFYNPDVMVNVFIEEIIDALANIGLGEDQHPKEKVLIIDDLDRVDPNHIFRILNVFSVHFDPDREYGNKFGFDKVILVGDIENIRRIFHAKYSSEVDFSGYIDKFYSKEVFRFDNQGIYEGVASDLCESTTPLKERYKDYIDKFFAGYRKDLWVQLIMDLVGLEVLNLRRLLKLYKQGIKLDIDKKIISHGNRLFFGFDHYGKHPSVIFFVSLMPFFDTPSGFLTGLEKIKDIRREFYWQDFANGIRLFLAMLDHQNTNFKDGEYEYKDIVNEFNIKYNIQSNIYGSPFYANINDINGWGDNDRKEVYFNHYLLETAKILVDLKVIK